MKVQVVGRTKALTGWHFVLISRALMSLQSQRDKFAGDRAEANLTMQIPTFQRHITEQAPFPSHTSDKSTEVITAAQTGWPCSLVL